MAWNRRAAVPGLCLFGLCLFVGLVHGLPHILIPLQLSSSEHYTPFAVKGVSALTFDESSIYAAQTNYTAVRWKAAYDTDIYEYRDVPAVFPYVPFYGLAALARAAGGTDRAFIICDFVFPAVAFLLVWFLVSQSTGSGEIGALASLATILISFGPRNFFRLGSFALQPSEYSRMLHPQLSFTLFLAALCLLWLAIERRSMTLLIANGVAGGVLFYVYAYYWPVWLGGCAILCLILVRRLWISLAVALATGSLFWFNLLSATRFPNYVWRTARFGVESGHVPSLRKVIFTVVAVALFASFLAVSRSWPAGPKEKTIRLFWGALFVAACCALNEEVVTGMNVESLEHYPNRLFQPFLFMAFFALVVPPLRRALSPRSWRVGMAICIALMLGIATIRQTSVAANTARLHVYSEEERSLYEWLNRSTAIDSVILLPVSELSNLLPVYTHNCQWIPDGTRTTASNEEILERFLAGAKLVGHSEEWVRSALAQNTREGDQPLGITYVYYLFQANYDSPDRRLRDPAIDAALGRFRAMDLRNELSRFRLDYVYARGSEEPVAVPGYTFRELNRNPYGRVYAVASLSGAGKQ